jgi:hypothetical protein
MPNGDYGALFESHRLCAMWKRRHQTQQQLMSAFSSKKVDEELDKSLNGVGRASVYHFHGAS